MSHSTTSHFYIWWNRWYQNPSLDLTTIPMVGLEHSATSNAPSQSDACLHASSTLIGPLLSNPLEKTDSHSLPRLTDTLPTRTIHHETQAAVRQITAHIQTHEQLDQLLEQVDSIIRESNFFCQRYTMQL